MLTPTDRVLAKKFAIALAVAVKDQPNSAEICTNAVLTVAGNADMAEAMLGVLAELADEADAITNGLASSHG